MMKKGNWKQHIVMAVMLAVFVMLGLACETTPKDTESNQSRTAGLSSRQTQAMSEAQYWTGDGGRNISIAILPPQAIGLTENQSYLPALVQGEFVSNFSTYSAISILDRQRLNDQYAELFSGYYDDNAAELIDIGHLSPTTHILAGNITRTETGYALQMYATKSADKLTVASYSGTFTFAELDNLSGIRQASFELLQKLGVTLTTKTQEELTRPAPANHVSAQTALAHGITAQQQGNTETALNYYFQAAAFDPSLIEAHNRTQILAAYVEGGITFSETISASITTANPSNRYAIVLLMPGRVSTSVTSDGSNRAMPNQGVDVQWLNADSMRIGGSSGGFNFPYNDEMHLDAGIYHIEVNGRPGIGNTGTYNIRIDYFTDEREPNNTRPNAQVLVSGLTVRGQLTTQDNSDIFRYDLTIPGRLTVNITGDSLPSSGANIHWIDVDGNIIRRGNSHDWGVSFPYNEYMDLEAGTYYIAVISYSNRTGTYNLRGTFTPANNNETEPNSTRATAQLLTSGQTVRASLSLQDDMDMFRFDLTQPSRLTVNVTRDSLPNQGANIHWLDMDGNVIRRGNSNDWGVSFPYNQSMDLEAGTYFIAIIRYNNNTGTYNLRGDVTAR